MRVWTALESFGAPLENLTVEDLSAPDVVFQIGVAPNRIDLLTAITGVDFETAWEGRTEVRIGDQTVSVLGRKQLIVNKRAVGRLRDLADVEDLERT